MIKTLNKFTISANKFAKTIRSSLENIDKIFPKVYTI